MKKSGLILVFLVVMTALLQGEAISWTDTTDAFNFPEGITLHYGRRNSPALNIWVLEVDLNREDLAVRPYITTSTAPVRTLAQRFNVYAAINGGYFGGSTSYSAVIYPGEVKARNIGAVTRNNLSYPLMRSLFSMDENGGLSVDWIYHFGSKPEQTYRYDAPMDYVYNDPTPKPAPSSADGIPMEDLLVGIGGGPTLVKDGQVHITYNEEIMWGSGVGLTNNDPRTAVGYTADRHVIMVTADGRQVASSGVSLNELADIMISFGCVEAMNLDGGGSTQMAVPGKNINTPSENRSVPVIFAVVHYDSLGLVEYDDSGIILDTEDERCEFLGSDWFPTANPGYWGVSPAMLNVKGEGMDQAVFSPRLPRETEYHVYAWWVPASNRCLDTPVVVKHRDGRDTVRVNQTQGAEQWNYIGTYPFAGDSAEQVIISDAATSGFYVVADAVRFMDVDSSVTRVVKPDHRLHYAKGFTLGTNYPNPFNAETVIPLHIDQRDYYTARIYSLRGTHVTTLLNAALDRGEYQLTWNGRNIKGEKVSSGIYFLRFTNSHTSESRKLLLMW
ncbi:MAG: hypothetical protein DRP86_06050 [Candidatus Neomarinimicrobiota bacterium]|nr:MAG: hypothetical protein DRP86_06050 [Candidatus Neomarinimicrobiota bacterium]